MSSSSTTEPLTAEQRREIRTRFLSVDTSNVADVLDERGLPNQGLHSGFRAESGTRLAGWAYTIGGETMSYEGSGDPDKMQACGGIGQDQIAVWAGDGQGVCYFGELIALGMMERGCVGALVDGGVRDTRWLGEHEFPVFARYHTPIQSIGRWKVTKWADPVFLAGATVPQVLVRPWDFVLADEDGAVVVPAEHVLEVLERSEELTSIEVKVRGALKSGKTLAQCLQEFGHV